MTEQPNFDATIPKPHVKRIRGGPPEAPCRTPRAASRATPARIQRAKTKVIFDAALDVFSARGVRGTTLDKLAQPDRRSRT